jgi:PAS domain S-box-containing protein
MKNIILPVIAILGICGIYLIDHWQVENWGEVRERELLSIADKCQIQLEKAFDIRFIAVASLRLFFENYPDTPPEKFAVFADHLMQVNPPIRALQWADQQTRVTYVYPPKGNEITLINPMTLISDPKRGPFVKKAIDQKRAVVQGPFELRQGGTGLVLRSPIFVEGNFSGLAIGVFDVPAIISEGLDSIDTKQVAFQIIADAGSAFAQQGELSEQFTTNIISVGDQFWELRLGWNRTGADDVSTGRVYIWVIGIVILTLFIGLLYSLFYQYQKLESIVNVQTRDLSEKNRALSEKIIQIEQAKAVIKQNETQLETVFRNSPIGIELYDTHHRLINLNKECMNIFGVRNREDVLGFDLFEDPNLPQDLITQLKNGKPVHFEKDFDFGIIKSHQLYPTNRDGVIHLEIFITPMRSDVDEQFQYLVHVLDVTEKKESEKMLIEHQKLSLVGKIAGKMAHDFNNVLGIIMGNAELALVDNKDPKLNDVFNLIVDQTRRGRNLTKNLVAFAKNMEPKLSFFNISHLLQLVTDLMKRDLDGIEVVVEKGSELPDLLADSGMIEHALVNLVQNAVDAVGMAEHPKIVLRSFNDQNRIFIEVEDNGCGIPGNHINDIWEPSFTLKGSQDFKGVYEPGTKGTGYGLANVKKYIQQHGGSVTCESDENRGTKIIISLPVVNKTLTPYEYEKVRMSTNFTNKRILVVEDESAISEVLSCLLTTEPCMHDVDICEDGETAIEMFESKQYDLVSLDYILSGKANGIDVYHYIRRQNSKIPILFVSGNIEFIESLIDLRQKDPYIDHLPKPCTNKEYLAAVNLLLEKVSTT